MKYRRIETTAMKLKKGDKVVFNFHGLGEISKEETTVYSREGDIIEVDSEEWEGYKFDLKTGKCINDNNYMGCYRTLAQEYLL